MHQLGNFSQKKAWNKLFLKEDIQKKRSRIQRIAREIQKKIAVILQCNIKDPRIGIVTVSNIQVSRDLAYAKVFVTFLSANSSEEKQSRVKVLQEASGFIRANLGKMMYLRVLPKLDFNYDGSLTESIRITKLINQHIIKNLPHCSNGSASK